MLPSLSAGFLSGPTRLIRSSLLGDQRTTEGLRDHNILGFYLPLSPNFQQWKLGRAAPCHLLSHLP